LLTNQTYHPAVEIGSRAVRQGRPPQDLSVASGLLIQTQKVNMHVENNLQFNNNTMNLTDAIKHNKNP